MTGVFIAIMPMMVMFGLFIWQAVWVAIDSRKRREEFWWLWTIAAFMAFPIGIIVYALVSRSDRRRCNNCGKEVPQNLNLCPYCGQKCGFFCPSCGQNVQPGWKFCPNCTKELPEEIVNSTDKNRNNKPIIIMVTIIAIIALLFIGMFVAGAVSFNSLTEVHNKEISISGASQLDGYQGKEYDKSITEVLEYTIGSSHHSFWYKGQRKKGYIVVKVYDKDGNLQSESDKITSDEFTEGIWVEPGQKVEIYLNDYKGSFYVRFN